MDVLHKRPNKFNKKLIKIQIKITLLGPDNPKTMKRDATRGRADGRTGGRADERTDGRTSGRADGRTDGRTGGRADGRTDGRTSGRADGRTDGPHCIK